MTAAVEKLYNDFLTLPSQDRAELAEMIIHEQAPGMAEDDPAFLEELARREADILSGKTIGIPVEEVFAQIDAHLAARRR